MILSILYFVLILGTIVLVHEFGHFFFAKLFGVYVYEFSIGMGPKLFGKKGKNGETEYCLRAIPIGGFVQLAGEGLEDDKEIPKKRLLQSKPVWQRFLIMFFGAGNNFILTIVTLFVLALIVGAPSNSNLIMGVVPESPAEIAGIVEGDYIVEVNGKSVSNLDELQLYLTIETMNIDEQRVKDKEENITKTYDFEIKVQRGKEKLALRLEPLDAETAKEKEYSIGIEFDSSRKHGFFAAVSYAFKKTGSLIKQMVITIKELVTGNVSTRNLSGPVGILRAVDQTQKESTAKIVDLFSLLALLSLNVGFINLIPFPAFDGGRILFLFIEKIKGKPIKPEVENMVNNIGFILLILLIVYVTFGDLRNWIGF
ncbi:MAG: RIP metalloprotease RseP [Bacilli bacterium]|nr:RIP metalloprotease RseP [Bacilli bacterium]